MSKRKTAFLKEENLLTLLSQNVLIIPEIQREYVWGENKKVILRFLTDLKNKIGVCCPSSSAPSSQNKINVGFLYTYKPDYVKPEQSSFLDENLIDGQQRFTTLFLLLFYCALKEDRKQEFLVLIRFEEKTKMSLSFRVRDLTKNFLFELVEKVDKVEGLINIDQQTWFLQDYKNDVSIKAMQRALVYISEEFSDNTRYFNHLINYVVFWHFKTEATSQGEELYITMNARGEDLADNEVTKAALMVGDSELKEWGQKWEEWQQFFWKHRDKDDTNPSADKGLNGFLKAIAGLESFLNYKEWETAEKDIQKLLTLEKVETYFNSFKYLTENKSSFKKQYNYCRWVDSSISEIWKIFNSDNTNWFADYNDANKGTDVSRMVFLWSTLHYLHIKKDKKDVNEVFRILRFLYLRFKNFNRAIKSFKSNIEQIDEQGLWNISCEPEEQLKHNFLKEVNPDQVREFEEVIWEIEDHPLNLDGSEVKNINISHLVDLTSSPTLQDLRNVKDSFNKLFLDGSKKGSSILKTILLHYGEFYKNTSPYNNSPDHRRFDFSDWKNNIRKPEFSIFFNDIIGKDHKQHLNELEANFIKDNQDEIKYARLALPNNLSLRKKIIYYSLLISSDDLWKEGEKISIRHETECSRLFKDEDKIIYNSKGNFQGHTGNMDLWKKAKENFADPLQGIKSRIIN